jgi:hypothetical protein
MSLATDDSIGSIKIGRITQQSIAMLKHIKAFLNVQFKISEVEDDVYSDSDSEEESQPMESEEEEPSEKAADKKTGLAFPKSFIFSCIGVGLTNIARKTE